MLNGPQIMCLMAHKYMSLMAHKYMCLTAHNYICLMAHKKVFLVAHKYMCVMAHQYMCLMAHKYMCLMGPNYMCLVAHKYLSELTPLHFHWDISCIKYFEHINLKLMLAIWYFLYPQIKKDKILLQIQLLLHFPNFVSEKHSYM